MAGRWDGPQRRAWIRHYYSQRQKRLMTVRGGNGDGEVGRGGGHRDAKDGGGNGAIRVSTKGWGCKGVGTRR